MTSDAVTRAAPSGLTTNAPDVIVPIGEQVKSVT